MALLRKLPILTRGALARPLAFACLALLGPSGCERAQHASGAESARVAPRAPTAGLRLVHHETFDTAFQEPAAWVEDAYGPQSAYHVDAFDEDGEFFQERGGEAFRRGLASFRSFRKSFPHGEGGWLTVELYGRDADADGVPETGGRFVSDGGKARLVSARHYDAAIIRSTEPLPARYRVEVTVSDIAFGGDAANGYDGDELADPWRFDDESPKPRPATGENGVYFLCITDYPRPAPHNNVFIHHHRKVVMDTDNNVAAWSKVWNPLTGAAEPDGSRYVSMIWLRGDEFGSDWTGNPFVSWAGGAFRDGPIFVDAYLPGHAYVFAVERDEDGYTLSVAGTFARGGATTYSARRPHRGARPTWHYNQRPEEHPGAAFDETRSYLGRVQHTWPVGSMYPDHFFFGDPHINFYEGSARYDDVKLYLPE